VSGSSESSRTATALKAALAVAIVVGIFVGVLPKIADMREVWRHLRDIGSLAWLGLAAVTLWNQVTYWWVTMVALPGLSFGQAATVNLSSTAVANTVPAGGGVGVGVSAAMLGSWDFSPGEIGRFVLVTAVWNNFVKLGMPIVALALLVLTGGGNGRLAVVSMIGLLVLGVAVVLLYLVLRSEELARKVGAVAGTAASKVLGLVGKGPVEGWDEKAASFREDSVELLQRRWHVLTIVTLVGHVSLFAVLYATLRLVGVGAEDLSFAEALAGFALARLVTAIPLTPGAVGMIELGYVGAFVAMGAEKSLVVAAVLAFRTLTYLLPVPLGGLTYLVWRHRSDWRGDEDASDTSDDVERTASRT